MELILALPNATHSEVRRGPWAQVEGRVNDPRLVVISGVRRGTIVRIPKTGEWVGIGRNRDNELWILCVGPKSLINS